MFPCPQCSRNYNSQASLTRHTSNHAQESQHACQICHVTFCRRDILTRHMRLHGSSATPSDENAEDGEAMADAAVAEPPVARTRKRCHTACDQCRASRIKCNGQYPCSKCKRAGKECKYDSSSSRASRRHSSVAVPDGGFLPGDLRRRDRSTPSLTASQLEEETGEVVRTGLDETDASPADAFMDEEPALQDAYILPDFLDPDYWQWIRNSPVASGGPDSGFPEAEAEAANKFPTMNDLLQSQVGGEPTASFHISNTQPMFPMAMDFTISSQSPPAVVSKGPGQSVANNLNGAPVGDSSTHSDSRANLRGRAINEIITEAETISRPEHLTMAFWDNLSHKVEDAFGTEAATQTLQVSILQHFIDLYFINFHPLWPLLSRQDLNLTRLHPLLYLVLTTIGAMYAGAPASDYGVMMHRMLRKRLAAAIELEEHENDDDFIWLAQARLLTQVTALYLAEAQSISHAQRLGALLVVHARRLGLFSYASCQAHMKRFHLLRDAGADSERLRIWLAVEGRRRLAFGIFRAETFTSILLNTKPLVTLDEIDLEFPSCDAVWGGKKLDSPIALEMIDNNRSPSQHLRASDLYYILMDCTERLPPLEPVAHELALFGLQSIIWRFSHDHHLYKRLTGSEWQSHADQTDGESASEIHVNFPHLDLYTSQVQRPRASEAESLDTISRQMRDLTAERHRLLLALKKWEQALSEVKTFARTEQDRSFVMSSLILYHVNFMSLYAPVGDVHKIQQLLIDRKPLDNRMVKGVRDWAHMPQASRVIDHIRSMQSLITHELQRETDRSSKFNILAFLGLHHGSALLWAYIGARDRTQDGSCASGREPGNNGENSRKVDYETLRSLVGLYKKISPAQWTSFNEMSNKLQSCEFPKAAG